MKTKKDAVKSGKKKKKDEEREAITAPEMTPEEKGEVLTDFRSVVETGPAEEGNDEKTTGKKDVVPAPLPPLNPANRLVIRCIACGHFLFEVIADRSYQKALCRQAECKALIEVTVEGNSAHITVTRRADRERGTMRF